MKGVSFEILEYLDRHPGAKDTLEGIVEWWLLETQIQRAIGQVKASLDALVELQLVQPVKSPDGRIVYKLNQRKRRTVRKLLENRAAEQEEIPRVVVVSSRRKGK